MSFKMQFSETRPNINVQFYEMPQEIVTYILNTYAIDLSSNFWKMSSDSLTRIGVAEFRTEEKIAIFNSDARLISALIEKEQEYNKNGIIRTVTMLPQEQDPGQVLL
jgi:hypothetical protein